MSETSRPLASLFVDDGSGCSHRGSMVCFADDGAPEGGGGDASGGDVIETDAPLTTSNDIGDLFDGSTRAIAEEKALAAARATVAKPGPADESGSANEAPPPAEEAPAENPLDAAAPAAPGAAPSAPAATDFPPWFQAYAQQQAHATAATQALMQQMAQGYSYLSQTHGSLLEQANARRAAQEQAAAQQHELARIEALAPKRPPANATAEEWAEYAEKVADFKAMLAERRASRAWEQKFQTFDQRFNELEQMRVAQLQRSEHEENVRIIEQTAAKFEADARYPFMKKEEFKDAFYDKWEALNTASRAELAQKYRGQQVPASVQRQVAIQNADIAIAKTAALYASVSQIKQGQRRDAEKNLDESARARQQSKGAPARVGGRGSAAAAQKIQQGWGETPGWVNDIKGEA